MRGAERHAFANQVIRHFGRRHETLLQRRGHALALHLHVAQHRRENAQRDVQRRNRVEQRLFVFLHVAVIAQRQRFHQRQHRRQIAIDAPGFAANQFRHIRVFLLRHDAAAGAEGVAQFDKAEFGRRPENQFFAEAAEVHHQNRRVRAKFQNEVAVADAVETVRGNGGKAQFLRHHDAVNRVRGPGKRRRTERQHVDAGAALREAFPVAFQHFVIREQMMAEHHRLRPL